MPLILGSCTEFKFFLENSDFNSEIGDKLQPWLVTQDFFLEIPFSISWLTGGEGRRGVKVNFPLIKTFESFFISKETLYFIEMMI